MSPFQGFVPQRKDLFDRATNSFHSTLMAIGNYKTAISGAMQEPGTLVDDAILQQFYGEYLKCRGALLMAFQSDIPLMDRLLSDVLTAIEETQGKEPPSETMRPGDDLLQLDDPDKRKSRERKPSPVAKLNFDNISDADCLEALQVIEEALGLLPTLPDAASDFSDSVEEKLTGIRDKIVTYGKVSEKQLTAVNNMYSGALKWVRDYD